MFRGSRGTYRYQDVTVDEWRALKRAPSKGTYLNAVFKAAHPRFERLIEAAGGSIVSVAAGAAALRDVPDENVWGFYENSL